MDVHESIYIFNQNLNILCIFGFKFLRILYRLYKILAIFKVKEFYPIEFGEIIF
jgi:hypothetical protein